MDYPESGNKKQKILIFAGVGFLFLLFIIFAIVSQLSRNDQQAAESGSQSQQGTEAELQSGQGSKTGTANGTGSGDNDLFIDPTKGASQKEAAPVAGAAAKIGEEIIYNVDITREVSALPNSDDPTAIRTSFQKIVNDSITLQGAAREGLIKLDKSVFNSSSKDYPKRITLVDEAKRKLDQSGDSYSGTMVSIWFYNQKPPKMGYAQAKQKAFNTIKPLYDKVKAGQMTMLEASDAIIADDSLYDVDEAFKVNSYGEFVATPDNPATFDAGFNTQLARLKQGEVSSLYLAKSDDINGNIIDAVYIFAKIDKIISGKGYTDYTGWLELQKPKYEVTEY